LWTAKCGANFKGTNCHCPFCQPHKLPYQNPDARGGDATSPFYQLAYAIEQLRGVKDRVQVEFVIPDAHDKTHKKQGLRSR
jgi:hypothetical protein